MFFIAPPVQHPLQDTGSADSLDLAGCRLYEDANEARGFSCRGTMLPEAELHVAI